MGDSFLYQRDYMDRKYLKDIVKTVEFQTDRNLEIFIYHTWTISSLFKNLQGLPSALQMSPWLGHVYMSGSNAPQGSLSHCTYVLSPASPLPSVLMISHPTVPGPLCSSSVFGLNALSSPICWAHYHLKLFLL